MKYYIGLGFLVLPALSAAQSETAGYPQYGTLSSFIYASSAAYQNTSGSTQTYTEYNVCCIGNSVYGSSATGSWNSAFTPIVTNLVWQDGYATSLLDNMWTRTWIRNQTRLDTDSLDFTRPTPDALRYHDFSPVINKETLSSMTKSVVDTSPW